jgi:hypothetical protein
LGKTIEPERKLFLKALTCVEPEKLDLHLLYRDELDSATTVMFSFQDIPTLTVAKTVIFLNDANDVGIRDRLPFNIALEMSLPFFLPCDDQKLSIILMSLKMVPMHYLKTACNPLSKVMLGHFAKAKLWPGR